MVIMWPDTTISDDRRARVSRLGSTGVQVDTGPHSIVNTVSSQRMEQSDEPRQTRTRQLAPGWKMFIR